MDMEGMRVNFKARQDFINVLLQLGFRDTTKKYYPEHYKLMIDRGYDPASIKRNFTKGKIDILFDYINIRVSFDNVDISRENESSLPDNEFVSVMFYNSLNLSDKLFFERNDYFKKTKITEIWSQMHFYSRREFYLDADYETFQMYQRFLNSLERLKYKLYKIWRAEDNIVY